MATHSSILAWRSPHGQKSLWTTVHSLQSQTRLKRLSMHAHMLSNLEGTLDSEHFILFEEVILNEKINWASF